MTTSNLFHYVRLAIFGLLLPPSAVQASTAYIPLARAVLAAPIVAKAIVHGQHRPAKPDRMTAPGMVRAVIEADLQIVYKASSLQPPRLSFLWEGEPDFKGNVPRFKKQTLLLFVAPEGPPGEARAAALGGQITWSTEDESMIRAILKEATADPTLAQLHLATLRQASVTVTAERFEEVQFLIDTTDGLPISLVIRDDKLYVARGDTSADALPVQPNSLLWLHLSCDLPRQMPDTIAMEQPTKAEAHKVRRAYATVLTNLGTCS